MESMKVDADAVRRGWRVRAGAGAGGCSWHRRSVLDRWLVRPGSGGTRCVTLSLAGGSGIPRRV